MGTLSGVNIAGQQPNPPSPSDLTAAKMQKIARDMEYTAINGVYNKATADNEVNKTRGIAQAVTTNALDAGGKPLGLWVVAEMLKLMYENNAPTEGLVLWLDATSIYQLNADALANGATIV